MTEQKNPDQKYIELATTYAKSIFAENADINASELGEQVTAMMCDKIKSNCCKIDISIREISQPKCGQAAAIAGDFHYNSSLATSVSKRELGVPTLSKPDSLRHLTIDEILNLEGKNSL